MTQAFSALAVSGSPRGRYSVSLRFARYLSKRRGFACAEIDAGKDGLAARAKAVDAFFREADRAAVILWTYPVYSFGVPSQFLAFLNALADDPRSDRLGGKAFAQILTSKHFYDTTAMAFVSAFSRDLGMRSLGEYSGEPEDLLSSSGRASILSFWDQAMDDMSDISPAPGGMPRRFLVLTDGREDDGIGKSLDLLYAEFGRLAPGASIETLDIADADVRGGCLGCLRCLIAGECAYKDGYGALMEKVVSADAVVFAQRIARRWFRPAWKRFDDRCFRFGHRLTMEGKPFLYIIGGDMDASPYLRDMIVARSHMGGNPLAGILVDGPNSSGCEAGVMGAACRKLLRLADGRGYKPVTFWKKGGMKIFRDLVFEMRGLMKKDDRFYRKHGLYDFPHHKRMSILKGYVGGAALSIPAIRRKAMGRLLDAMTTGYDRVIARQGGESGQAGDQ